MTPSSPRWVEVLSQDGKALRDIGQELGVHPLALEDCEHRDQRPKLDDYGNHQLLVWFMVCNGQVWELQFLIFPEALVVVPHDPPPGGGPWRVFLNISPDARDVWHLLYTALDRCTDLTGKELRGLVTQIDDFEEAIFQENLQPQQLMQVKKKLTHVDFFVAHLPSIAQQLQNLCNPQGDLIWKLRDLHDHCERIARSLVLYRSQIGSAIDLFWGLQANRTNSQIKKLSLLASVAVPLTFWASFWGMNFQLIPFENPMMFWAAMGLMLLSVMFTSLLLIRKGYWSE